MARARKPLNKHAGFSLLESTASILLLSGIAAAALPKLEALEAEAQTNGHEYVVAAEQRADELAALQRKHF